ncbi:hypothetical protein BGZ74_000694 [Mortierella antarctica]|nr:hypothetical protein BGZ74_000694 [Mortierella antarctica]
MKFTTAIAVAAAAAVANAQAIQFASPNVDPNALQHKDVLGKIDCANSNLTNTNLKVPENLASGTAYVLQAMTDPNSYSPAFTIDSDAPPTSNPPPANTDAAKSAGNSLTAPSAMLAVAGVVAALAL